MKKFLAALAACVFVAGCASSGVQVKDEHLSSFVPGQTTRDEVIARLGAPTTSIRNADGTSTIMYTYAEARTRASSFIPIVGLFVGGADMSTSNVALQFDKQGKLIGHSASESEMGTATGIAVDAQPVLDQPRKN